MKNVEASAPRPPAGRLTSLYAALAAAVLALSACAYATSGSADGPVVSAAAQSGDTAFSGEWTAEFRREKPGQIQFTFHRRSKDGGFSMSGDTFSLSEFQGLSPDAATAARANVNFTIAREAGTFSCEGFFREGKGAGFWTLTPNQGFVSAMRARGYGNLSGEDLLRAALHNLTTKYVDDLKAAGYDRLTFEELNRASNHDITVAFIREMQSAGYEGLKMEELIRARNHEVDGEYVRQVRAMGFDKQPLEALIRMRNHEITQEFINSMRSVGFDNLTIEELIRLKNHDITPEFVNGLKAEGYAQIAPETAIRLKNHNVDADYIRRVKAKGFSGLSLEQIIRLRNEDIVK